MLPRENRLSSDFDFRRLRREGSRYGSPFFALFVLSNQRGASRFGFVISARVSKLATRRNRARRLLRDEVEKLLPRVRPGVAAAFWVRESAIGAPPEALRREVRDALKKARVYD